MLWGHTNSWISFAGNPLWPLALVSLVLVASVVCYALGMLAASRVEPTRRGMWVPVDDLFYVFLVPCLNEELVVLDTLGRLMMLQEENFAVMVIDDGSDDRTAELVRSAASERVWLFERKPPHAREGKGQALNAAVRYLRSSDLLAGHNPSKVIVGILDADGSIDADATAKISPLFADPDVGAVQIAVRINNRERGLLARLQDMEFVIYTDVFQNARRHLGSVGMGGNGQFMRLTALESLGEKPWSSSLTEDLDLGVRLLCAGWRNEYCDGAAVHQQGLLELKKLVRQRARWFQGHLQSFELLPLVARKAPRKARLDLFYYLTCPLLLLPATFLPVTFGCSLLAQLAALITGQAKLGWWLALTYALTFGPVLALSSAYWRRVRREGVSSARLLLWAHCYVAYSMVWYASGWRAMFRQLGGRTGWAKTARSAVTLSAEVQAALGAGALAGGGGPNVITAASALTPPTAAAPELAFSPASTFGPAAPLAPAALCWWRSLRRWVLSACMALVLLSCALFGALSAFGSTVPKSPWQVAFNGYGHVAITKRGITLAPARTNSPSVTHSALVLSRAPQRNFTLTVRVDTLRQLRSGGAGAPNAWESGWVLWRYSSTHAFYALTLEQGGWVLSKQDPAYPGQERFLASGHGIGFAFGHAYTVTVIAVANRMRVLVNGAQLVAFSDAQRPYLRGKVGFYTEDAVVRYTNPSLTALPASASLSSPLPTAKPRCPGALFTVPTGSAACPSPLTVKPPQ